MKAMQLAHTSRAGRPAGGWRSLKTLRTLRCGAARDMIGQTVSHYRVIAKLGMGGMGVVYEAEDERLPRRVALKFLSDELADDADAARRLRREAQTIALLNHPNICTIYDVDDHDGRLFIAMERLDGSTLKAYLARHTLTTAQLADIASQIARALAAAHEKGIIHRDIKPGNIFITRPGHVKVLDFGLARRLSPTLAGGEPSMEGSTIPGRPLGTASYMAPERILQAPLDARSDLFSLGVVIYEMATGRLPFTAASPAETVMNILDKEPASIVTLSPERPRELQRIVARLLTKEADGRYASALSLDRDLVRLRNRFAPSPIERLFARLRGR
jgi:serine/threonine protein kinase